MIRIPAFVETHPEARRWLDGFNRGLRDLPFAGPDFPHRARIVEGDFVACVGITEPSKEH
jgi:hypothetical protein